MILSLQKDEALVKKIHNFCPLNIKLGENTNSINRQFYLNISPRGTKRQSGITSGLILFQNESQKPGQKTLMKMEKHNFYLLGHSESLKNLIFYHELCFFYLF